MKNTHYNNFVDKSKEQFWVCYVPTKDADPLLIPNLYNLNAVGGNVSIYAQQRRAIFLSKQIYATKNNGGEAPSVAVCGGGIAGTTLFMALLALGLSDVTLIESRRSLLESQAEADHRYAHPSLAEWPLEQKFTSSTNLPLMNWAAGVFPDVFRQLTSDSRYRALIEKHHDKIYLSYKTELIWLNQATKKFRLKAISSERVPANKLEGGKEYDVVVSATGFGIERGDPMGAYFEWDPVKTYDGAPEIHRSKHLTILGGGDGALIDAIRGVFGCDIGESRNVSLVADLRGEEVRSLTTVPYLTPYQQTQFEKNLASAYKSPESNFTGALEQEINAAVEGDSCPLSKYRKRYDCATKTRREVKLVSTTDPLKIRRASPVCLLGYKLLLQEDGTDQNLTRIQFQQGKWKETDKKAVIDSTNEELEEDMHFFVNRTGTDNKWTIELNVDNIIVEPLPYRPEHPKNELAENALSSANNIIPQVPKYGPPAEGMEDLFWKGLDAEFSISKDMDDEAIRLAEKKRKKAQKKYETELLKRYAHTFFRHAKAVVHKDSKGTFTLPFANNINKTAYQKTGGYDQTVFGVDVRYMDRDNEDESVDLSDDSTALGVKSA